MKIHCSGIIAYVRFWSIASLIDHSGSSAFRPTTTTAVSMSLTGSCFSSESAPGPSIMGVDDDGNRLKLGVVGRSRVPIELHPNSARPFDDRIAADGVVEWCDNDGRVVGLSGPDSRVEVRHKIACSFGTKRIRDWRLEGEYREGADRRENEFKCRLARRRRDAKDGWLRLCSAGCCNETIGKAVEIAGRNVNMRRIVLRTDRNGCGSISGRVV
jgi:hypothetical protein